MRITDLSLGLFFVLFTLTFFSGWLIIALRQKIPASYRNPYIYIFHSLSEIIPSITGVVLFFFLWQGADWARPAAVLNLGFIISFAFHATCYNLFSEPKPGFALLTGIFLLGALLLTVFCFLTYSFSTSGPVDLLKTGLFFLGNLLYILLNIAAEYGKAKEWAAFYNLIILFAAGAFFSVSLIVTAA